MKDVVFFLVFSIPVLQSGWAHSGERGTDAPWVPDSTGETYRNPVLFADYSDPDVCRRGEFFYLVSSSFNQVPGLPILESRDLVNWKIVGHALFRISPYDRYDSVRPGDGVLAPAIRFHAGRFHIYYPDPESARHLVSFVRAPQDQMIRDMRTSTG